MSDFSLYRSKTLEEFSHKELEPVTVEQSRSMTLAPQMQEAEEAKQKLKADANIVPLSKEKQVQTTKFDKAGFVKDVKELNRISREMASEFREKSKKNLQDAYELAKTLLPQKVPKDIKKVFDNIKEYTSIKDTAKDNANSFFARLGLFTNRSRLKKEHKLIGSIPQKIEALQAKYADNPAWNEVLKELEGIKNVLKRQSGINARKEGESQEEQYKRKNWSLEHAKQIDGTGRTIQTSTSKKGWFGKVKMASNTVRDRRDWPLFAHEPTCEDVRQASEGNCWFLATCASMTSEQIKNMMMDNGDGSVTVRFYDESIETEKMEPVYVTVDKSVKINSAYDCLWVQVLEKAYAVFLQEKNHNEIKTLDEEEVTGGRKLSSRVVDYGYISNGGHSNEALAHFLGLDSQRIEIEEDEMGAFRSEKFEDIIFESYRMADEDSAKLLQRTKYGAQIDKCDAKIKKYKEDFKNQFSGQSYEERIDFHKKQKEEFEKALKEAQEKNDQEEIRINQKLIQGADESIADCDSDYAPYKERIDYWEAVKITYETDRAELGTRDSIINRILDMTGTNTNVYEKERIMDTAKDTMPFENKLMEHIKSSDPGMGGGDPAIQKAVLGALSPAFYVLCADFLKKSLIKEIAEAFPDIVPMEDVEEVVYHNDTKKITREKVKHISSNVKLDNFENLLDQAEKTVAENGEFFEKILQKESNYKSFMETYKTMTKASDEIVVELMRDLSLQYIKKAKINLRKVDGMPPKIIDGEYSNRVVDYYNRIEGMIRTKQNVCIGTKKFKGSGATGNAGEETGSGMVATHAYSVLDVRTLESGRRMVLLRNPWASDVAEYQLDKDSDSLESEAEEYDNNGMFWIELNHLMYRLGNIYSSGVS